MNSRLPKISIVIPSFNQGRFIGETFASIFDQAYPNLEVVVMDGGSSDNSVSVIASYSDHLTYWQSKPDKGQAAAINEGMTHCTGDLVAWLNSDDFYCGDSLWVVASAFVKYPGRGLYIGNGYRYYQSTGEKEVFCPRHVAFNHIALTEGLDYILQPSTFILREAWETVGGLNTHLQYGLDWDLFLRIAERYPVVTINEFLSASREYGDTKTASGKMKRAIELIQIAQERSGKQITLGAAFYLFGTLLLSLDDSNLPSALSPLLSDAVDILRREMARSWGGDETFPVVSDPQVCTYLPFPTAGTSAIRKAGALESSNLPLISIIVPFYNRARFLSQALDSIFSQEYPNLETIVFDGGSTDESKVLEQYSDRLALWRSEPDRGPAHAIHKGFRVASGEILTWLSSDDMLAEGALWTVAKAFSEDPSLDMIVGNALYIDEGNELFLADDAGQRTGLYYGVRQPWRKTPAWWAHARTVPQPIVFFRRRLLATSGLGGESRHNGVFDFDLFWRGAEKARISKIDQVLSFYRIRGSKRDTSPLIAVDMTLMLPGGENGGSKILTLQVLDGLRRLASDCRLLLLTASHNHEELSSFDGPGVERLCVLQDQTPGHQPVKAGYQQQITRILLKAYYSLPQRVAPIATRLGQRAVRAFRCVRRFLRRGGSLERPSRLLSSRGVDLLFCPFTTPTYAEPNIPVVSVFYDLQHLHYPQFFTQQEISRRNTQMDQLRRVADRIICISEYTRQSLLAHLKIAPERTETVHVRVQSRLVRPTTQETAQLLSELDIDRHPYIFYPANFWPHKNHRMLLVAYGMLLSRNPGIDVDLVFTGALEEPAQELRGAVQRMGLSGRVHFLGYLPDDRLAAVFQGCKMVIVPSLYEGFGIPLLEAMSFGKPVLCSNVTSLPEIAGDAALFFDPRKPDEIVQAIEKVLTNPDLASELTQRGYQRVSEFKTEDMIHEYLNVFRELIAKPKMFSDTVSGIFEDGWTSEALSLSYGPGPAE